MKTIKGYIPNRPLPKQDTSVAESMLGTVALFSELKNTKSDVVNTVNQKLSEVDKSIQKIENAINEFNAAIANIKSLTYIKGEPGTNGNSPDPEAIARNVISRIPQVDERRILSKVPRIDEEEIVRKVISKIPQNKASLKVIQEHFEADPMSVIEKIMSLMESGKIKFKTKHIDGLEQTMSAFNNQLGRGYLHGGGDTVVAGTGIAITTNANGQKVITATGTVALTIIAVTGTVNDSNVTFTSTSLPTLLNINGAFYQQTGGIITWSRSGTTITLSSPVGTGGSIFGI